MSILVTNQKQFLDEIIKKILPSSKNLYFLVGYFYFSGFEQIYKSIGDKKMIIMVGLNIEKTIYNKIKEFNIIQELDQSRLEIKKDIKNFADIVELFSLTQKS